MDYLVSVLKEMNAVATGQDEGRHEPVCDRPSKARCSGYEEDETEFKQKERHDGVIQ